MKLKIFTIFDIKAEAYHPPFFMHAAGMAERAFINMAKDKTNQIGMNPEDYALIEIGEFDDGDASVEMLDMKKPLLTGLEAYARENPIHAISNAQLSERPNGGNSEGEVRP